MPDAIQRMFKAAALARERSSLGGTITFTGANPMPCAISPLHKGLSRAADAAGMTGVTDCKVVLRSELIANLSPRPQSGDTVVIKYNTQTTTETMLISADAGREEMNGILTAFNLYSPGP